MKTNASPADDVAPTQTPTDRHHVVSPVSPSAKNPASHTDISTPTKTSASSFGENAKAATASPRSEGPRRGRPASSCKRRRLASEDDENVGEERSPANGFGGSARKLNYESRNDNESVSASDDSDEDEDPIVDREVAQMRQESVLRKIQRLNYEEDEGDKLIATTAFAKLFEHVKDYDVVARASAFAAPARSEPASAEGTWKYRGSGYVKFIKCMEEGYNCGMIRAELTKNGTIETLMCHELTCEEVLSMQSKKGKAYTWRCKDWAYRTATRTFAIRFDGDMDALRWKEEVERSKVNNCRVRRGLDVPGEEAPPSVAVEEVCSTFRNLSTASASSP